MEEGLFGYVRHQTSAIYDVSLKAVGGHAQDKCRVRIRQLNTKQMISHKGMSGRHGNSSAELCDLARLPLDDLAEISDEAWACWHA